MTAGLLLAHPKMPELVGKLNFNEKTVNSDIKMNENELDDRLSSLFKQVTLEERQAIGKYTFIDGATQIAVFMPIDLPDGRHWVMIVAAPEEEVTREIATLKITMVAVFAVFIILAALFIVVISRRFVKPISMIRDECLILAQGDFREQKARITSEDEIGQLARGFREMSTNLLTVLIGEIQQDTGRAVLTMNDGIREVRTGVEVVNAFGGAFREIVELVYNLSSQVGEISAVIQQMASNTRQIVGSVQMVDGFSKKSADETQAANEEQLASMEDVASSAEVLAKMAQDLQAAVAKFQV